MGPKLVVIKYPPRLRSLGDHIRKRRMDLGSLQREVEEIIGVCADTVRSWEANRTVPSGRRLPSVRRFLWSAGKRASPRWGEPVPPTRETAG